MSRADYDFEKNAESRKDFMISVLINEMEKNYQSVNLADLSAKMGYHPDYIGRCIKSVTGFGFKEYLLRIRMSHVMNLLKNSDLSISEIAVSVGYQNETYFYKKFRELYGWNADKCGVRRKST